MVKINNLKNKLIILMWVFLVVLLSGTPFTTINTRLGYLIIPFGFLALILSVLSNKSFTINKKNILFVLLLTMIIFTAIVHFEFINLIHIKLAMTICLSFYLCNKYSAKEISNVVVNFMFWVTLVSIPLYFINNTLFEFKFLPVFSNVNDVKYGIGIIFNYILEFPERNCAIFWEPGIFASYISIALIFHILDEKKEKSLLKYAVFFIGLLTAQSSAGYVLGIMCVFLMLFKKMKRELSFNTVLCTILIFVVSICLINYESILELLGLADNPYVKKIFFDNILASSRFEAIVANFNVFVRNPIFGAGITYVNNNLVFCGDMATSTYLLSIYGILGSLFTIAIIFGVFKQKEINIYSKIIICFILLCIVNKEPHILSPFIWILIFCLCSKKMFDNHVLTGGLVHDK